MKDNRPPSGHWIFLLVYSVIAFSLPAGFAIHQHDWVSEHPIRATLILLVYAGVALPLGFAIQVWRHIQGRVIEFTADWLLAVLEDAFSRQYQRYCEYVFVRNRHIDAKTLTTRSPFSLPLARVFVEPNMVPRWPPEEPQERQRHVIWDYLLSKTLANQHFVVLGAPGSGKTTLLKHMSLALVVDKRQRRKFKVPYKLPILLTLHDHAEKIARNQEAIARSHKLSLAELVCADLPKEIPARWLERRLNQGRCLILLDELADVGNPDTRQKVVNWVQQQIYTYRKNRFILTSRPEGYHDNDNPLNDVAVLEMQPFTMGQIERFIHKWDRENEILRARRDSPGVKQDAEKKAQNLLQQMRSDPTSPPLEATPQQLMMIATVHRYSSFQSGRRVELFAQFFEDLLRKRQQPGEAPLGLAAAEKQAILQPLAYHMMCATDQHKRRSISLADALDIIAEPLERFNPNMPGESFLKMMVNFSGLLLEQGGVYSFAHRTYQEYLAACHIKEQALEAELVKRVGESWWHETIRLYSALADPTAIITACMNLQPLSTDALTLAFECLDEGFISEPSPRDHLEQQLEARLKGAAPQQQIIGKARLIRRLRHMPSLSFLNSSLITCAEYQLFLDEQRAAGRSYQPDHWSGSQFQPAERAKPMLGIRPSDAIAFCEWLTMQDPEWHYRLPTPEEAESDQAKQMTQAGYWTQSEEGEFSYRYIGKPGAAITTTNLDKRVKADLARARISFDLAPLEQALNDYLEHAHPHSHPLDLSDSIASALEYSRDLTFIPPLVRSLATALEEERDQALKLAHDLAISSERASIAPANHLHNASALASALTVASERILALAGDLERVITLTSAGDHPFRLALIRIRDRSQASENDSNEASGFLRWYIRLSALALVNFLFAEKPSPWRDRGIKTYLALYVDLTILEERVQGTLRPFEGILLAKERKHAPEQAAQPARKRAKKRPLEQGAADRPEAHLRGTRSAGLVHISARNEANTTKGAQRKWQAINLSARHAAASFPPARSLTDTTSANTPPPRTSAGPFPSRPSAASTAPSAARSSPPLTNSIATPSASINKRGPHKHSHSSSRPANHSRMAGQSFSSRYKTCLTRKCSASPASIWSMG